MQKYNNTCMCTTGQIVGNEGYIKSTHLDVTCPDERRLSLEVLRVDDVIFARVENEFRQMNLAFVDGVE